MRIFITGATGVVGRPLVRRLVAAGHDVSALTRSTESAVRLRSSGATAYVGDALDASRLRDVLAGVRPESVVHLLTSIPRRVRPRHMDRDMAATNHLRRQGTANLLAASVFAGVQRFVAQSVAFAYAPTANGRAATEESPVLHDAGAGTETLAAVSALERVCLRAPFDACVLRFGYLYGPGTAFAAGGATAEDAARGRLPVCGAGRGAAPFLHTDDAASALMAALQSRATGLFNVAEDDCPTTAEWTPRFAASVGGRAPRRVPRWIARLVAGRFAVHAMDRAPPVSSLRAWATLGWAPKHRWDDTPVLGASPAAASAALDLRSMPKLAAGV